MPLICSGSILLSYPVGEEHFRFLEDLLRGSVILAIGSRCSL